MKHVRTDLVKPYIIFDIDGTLSNIQHRVHHVTKDPKDWDSFNESMFEDEVDGAIWQIFQHMCNSRNGLNFPSIFVTGRMEKYRTVTENWLKKNNLVPDYLFMRETDDFRSDDVVKWEIDIKYISPAPILCVFDDRDKVVKMWRNQGYKCLQVQEGDF